LTLGYIPAAPPTLHFFLEFEDWLKAMSALVVSLRESALSNLASQLRDPQACGDRPFPQSLL